MNQHHEWIWGRIETVELSGMIPPICIANAIYEL